MEIIHLFKGVQLIRPRIVFDERGYFLETYQKNRYKALGIDDDFVQDNHSFSKMRTIRGMHFQRSPGQAKLIYVVSGEIFDVVVDIRPRSSTFRQWKGVHLSAHTHEQLLIPIGFAHGFCTLSETAHVCYKVSSMYDPIEEKGFRYDDSEIGIEWPCLQPILSQKDAQAPSFDEVMLASFRGGR
jgi:dTDP-4-dehydrorhamnose 3,5-epimerase